MTTIFRISSVVCVVGLALEVSGFQTVINSRLAQASTTKLHVGGIIGRFRKKKQVQQTKQIEVGAAVPDVDVEVIQYHTAKKGEAVTTSIREFLGSEGSAILVGMPGAFTPTCTTEHLPGYIKLAPKFKSLGIEKIGVMTTNDRHVNEEWGDKFGLVVDDDAEPARITILSDGDGELARAMGLAEDMGFGVGVRSKRFAMIVRNGIVSTLVTDEDSFNECSRTSAESLLAVLSPESAVNDEGPGVAVIGGGLALAALVFFTTMGGTGGTGGVSPSLSKPSPTPKVKAQPARPVPKSQESSGFNLLKEYL